MQIVKTLEVFCLVENVNQGLDIFLRKHRKDPLVCTRAGSSCMLTSFWMYSHTLSFTIAVRANVLMAVSISPIMPSWGCGSRPERMMFLVVMDGSGPSGPMSGEEVRALSSKNDNQGRICK